MSVSDDRGWGKADCAMRLANREYTSDLKGGQVSGLTETLNEADSENSGWGARFVTNAKSDAELRLCADATTSLAGKRGRLVVDSGLHPGYSLDELLAQCRID